VQKFLWLAQGSLVGNVQLLWDKVVDDMIEAWSSSIEVGEEHCCLVCLFAICLSN
jgi:hypothetical protein